MAKNKVNETIEVQAEVLEEMEDPKKKLNLKTIALFVIGGLATAAAVGVTVLKHWKSEKEFADYMESCGSEGTDLLDEDEAKTEKTED